MTWDRNSTSVPSAVIVRDMRRRIMGLSQRQMRERFDAIVDFAGLREFIDQPVKHYSSGMKVRLAFSVAAHLEPEILLIDEVLAVGDAEFQEKCLQSLVKLGSKLQSKVPKKR
jgi:lipopolysaccharide transport system ATP-binding protein